jgi:hypothetical protein
LQAGGFFSYKHTKPFFSHHRQTLHERSVNPKTRTEVNYMPAKKKAKKGGKKKK